MKTHGRIIAVVVLLLAAGCTNAPRVLQGTVISYDAASKDLVVRNEREPGSQLKFSLAHAEVGAEPKAGDVVRLSYRDEGGTLIAIRVMNLSQQEELQKKGH